MTRALSVPARLALALLVGSAVLGLGTPDARAGLLDDIKKKKEIVIATEAGYPPFEYVEGGKIVGYHADILALVMKDLRDQGVKITQLDLPFARVLLEPEQQENVELIRHWLRARNIELAGEFAEWRTDPEHVFLAGKHAAERVEDALSRKLRPVAPRPSVAHAVARTGEPQSRPPLPPFHPGAGRLVAVHERVRDLPGVQAQRLDSVLAIGHRLRARSGPRSTRRRDAVPPRQTASGSADTPAAAA